MVTSEIILKVPLFYKKNEKVMPNYFMLGFCHDDKSIDEYLDESLEKSLEYAENEKQIEKIKQGMNDIRKEIFSLRAKNLIEYEHVACKKTIIVKKLGIREHKEGRIVTVMGILPNKQMLWIGKKLIVHTKPAIVGKNCIAFWTK